MSDRPSTLAPPRRPDNTADFANSVEHERLAQGAKWGPQRHRFGDWMSVLGEEFGEACEAANGLIWHDTTGPGGKVGRRNRLRNELVQVAAVCAAVIEQIDEELADLDDDLAALEVNDGARR